MDEGEVALELADALDGSDITAHALDTGELYIEMPDGEKFSLTIEKIDAFPEGVVDEDEDEDEDYGEE